MNSVDNVNNIKIAKKHNVIINKNLQMFQKQKLHSETKTEKKHRKKTDNVQHIISVHFQF